MHLAIIMDGNGRYGKKVYGNRSLGHKDGANKLHEICKWCKELGVKYLTVYAFSTENWKRNKEEGSSESFRKIKQFVGEKSHFLF